MTEILALQKLEANPDESIPCFSVSWSGWSGVTA
ncbi:class III lanthipeptide [Actinospica durhamensis]|uniref:Class III lanthipeptide n=1 Tax=Actinospica durhamensis TaxID=1508375 RepID=A0A941IQM3_9ACTN|nr:class III lanthipeptide [Actinospica durhamensis]MBR7833083.1 class III lanthipeptide [Actinospica durhamensis]